MVASAVLTMARYRTFRRELCCRINTVRSSEPEMMMSKSPARPIATRVHRILVVGQLRAQRVRAHLAAVVSG